MVGRRKVRCSSHFLTTRWLPFSTHAQAGLQFPMTRENLQFCSLFADKALMCLLHARPGLHFLPPACELCPNTGNTARRPVKRQCAAAESLEARVPELEIKWNQVWGSVNHSRVI